MKVEVGKEYKCNKSIGGVRTNDVVTVTELPQDENDWLTFQKKDGIVFCDFPQESFKRYFIPHESGDAK